MPRELDALEQPVRPVPVRCGPGRVSSSRAGPERAPADFALRLYPAERLVRNRVDHQRIAHGYS